MSKKAKNQVATGGKNSIQMIARNKKALHDFFVEDTYEAGLVLTGTEVKSLRMGRASLSEAWVEIDRGEAWLQHAHIPCILMALGQTIRLCGKESFCCIDAKLKN